MLFEDLNQNANLENYDLVSNDLIFNLSDMQVAYQKHGFIVIPPEHPLAQQIDWQTANHSASQLQAYLVDTPGHACYEQCELADMHKTMGEVQDSIIKATLEPLCDFLGKVINNPELNLIRSKINSMSSGDFIRRHIDANDYPTGLVSVGLHLAESYTGGEFIVVDRSTGSAQTLDTSPGSIILWSMQTPHEVRKIESGKRTTVVHFLGT